MYTNFGQNVLFLHDFLLKFHALTSVLKIGYLLKLYNPMSTTLQLAAKTLQKCQQLCWYVHFLSITIHIGSNMYRKLVLIGIKCFSKFTICLKFKH